MDKYYSYSDFGYIMNEFRNSIEYEIYAAQKDKSKQKYAYIIIHKYCDNLYNYEKEEKEYNSEEEALEIIKKSANIIEKDESGQIHYYREYSCWQNKIESKERYELCIEKRPKGYFPKYNEKTLENFKKCITILKKQIFFQNISVNILITI